MNYWNYPYGPSAGGIGGFVTLIFWVLMIALIVAIIRKLMWGDSWGHLHYRDRGMNRKYPSEAIEILKERYARGEIDKAEFGSRKKDLME